MNKEAIKVAVGFLVLVVATTVFLVRMQVAYKLGNPGVKVVEEPVYDEHTNLVSTISVAVPRELAGYTVSNLPVTRLEADWLPKDTVYGRRLFVGEDGFSAMLSVVLMGSDRTSIHKPQYCLLGQGWRIDNQEVIEIPVWQPELHKIKAMKLSCSRPYKTRSGETITVKGLYIYWFVADGQSTPYHGERMWLMGRDRLLTGVLQRWSYISALTQFLPGQEEVYLKRLKGFLAETYPRLQAEKTKQRALAAAGDNNQTPLR